MDARQVLTTHQEEMALALDQAVRNGWITVHASDDDAKSRLVDRLLDGPMQAMERQDLALIEARNPGIDMDEVRRSRAGENPDVGEHLESRGGQLLGDDIEPVACSEYWPATPGKDGWSVGTRLSRNETEALIVAANQALAGEVLDGFDGPENEQEESQLRTSLERALTKLHKRAERWR